MYDDPNYSERPPGLPAEIPNNSTALISLIAGILGLTILPVVGSIVALITGATAKREIRESAGTQGGEGLAQAGIILGWIGIGLAVLGICITGVVLVIPFCLLALGLSAEGWGAMWPLVLTFL